MRLMRTAAIAATAIAATLLTGVSAAQAAPATRPGGDQAAGHVIRQHACQPGAAYAANVTGWLADDRQTTRRELKWLPMGGPTNGTWRYEILFTCYK